MTDALLTTLCQICHLTPPKYTCPRCAQQTCSLPCSARHKQWSQCNGVRDPTVYKPIQQVATPAGLDHDYNFLHGIEVGRDRTEREIVEERGLLLRSELNGGGLGIGGAHGRGGNRHHGGGGVANALDPLQRRIRDLRMEVVRAPRGMQRAVENGTSWSRNGKQINWQVEWIEDGCRRLTKVTEGRPIGEAWQEVCEAEQRKLKKQQQLVTDEEAALPLSSTRKRKRKRGGAIKESTSAVTTTKKTRRGSLDGVQEPAAPCRVVMQDLVSGAWNVDKNAPPIMTAADGGDAPSCSRASAPPEDNSATRAPAPQHRLYLHRPLTSASLPKVLVPLDASRSLSRILRHRVVLEFPCIYAMPVASDSLPTGFMLESAYAAMTGQAVPPDTDTDTEMGDVEQLQRGMSDDDATSSSGISSVSSSSLSDSEGSDGDDGGAVDQDDTRAYSPRRDADGMMLD